MGLLDDVGIDPRTYGLLSAGFGILGAAPGKSALAAIGQGGMQGLLGYQSARQALEERKLHDLQLQTGQINLDELKRKSADEKAVRDILKGIYGQQGMPQSPVGVPGIPAAENGGYSPPPVAASSTLPAQSSPPAAQLGNPQNGVAPKAAAWHNYKAIGDQMAANGLVDQAQQYYTLAEKFRPKYNAGSRTVRLPDGRIATVNMSEDGQEVLSGYAPAEKLHSFDLGGTVGAFDPYTGQLVNQFAKTVSPDAVLGANTTRRGQDMTDTRDRLLQSPQFQANVALEKKLAEGKAGAIQTLPQVIDTANSGIQNIEALIGKRDPDGNLVEGSKPHPGFSSSVGAKIPGLKYISGSDTADFNARLDQILGGAFMQAYQTLKGGGQITEIEGKKATDAITRMSTSQSEKEFIRAAQEFKGVMQAGVDRARAQAGTVGAIGGTNGVRRYNPATGRIE